MALFSAVLMGSSINSEAEPQVLLVRTFEGKNWLGAQGIYLYYGEEGIEKREVSKDYIESANNVTIVLNGLYKEGWKLISARELDGGQYNGPNAEYILEK